MKNQISTAIILLVTFNWGVSQNTSPNFSNEGRDWFISKTTGSGQMGTKERPAKDLGNIIRHLKPNDRIHIAEGIYLSKGSSGADEINVPVKIYGGYDTSFTTRDPWDAHKTIFTGTNEYMKSTQPRIYIRTDQQRENNGQKSTGSEIVVDGIIVDHGPRNRYHLDKNLAIRRKASPKTQQNPSPESGGIVIVGSNFTNVAVQNCVVMNTAPTEGAISVRVFKGGQGIIQNNFCINNTGYGIQARTGYMGSDESLLPKFQIKHNTVLFTWKHDPIASYGGDALAIDQNLVASIENNALGYGHMGGLYNKGAKITMKNNLFTGNGKYDYREINDKMAVADILDEAMYLDPMSDGNQGLLIKIPVAERWAEIYASRQEISREEVDAAVTVPNTGANQLRSIFGLNLQGSGVAMDAEIFLPLITIDEALPAGRYPWDGMGCNIPK
ncbi:hypothetical protein [Flagellimonas oceanensis]|uniref:hypothetical protein n=1 Tax=Flagellimonas oceanensis TaxID=2499163 RepID=UPI003BAC4638